jgi:Tfp pilus assembly protein PilV
MTRGSRINKKEKGFGMLEIIIALTVFSMGVLSAMASLSLALRSASTSHLNLVAANLAQEGIEIVRNRRDANWVDRQSWDRNMDPGVYKVYWKNANLDPVNPTQSLLYDGVNGGFNYTAGQETVYSRTITINRISADQMQVISTVQWRDKATVKLISAEAHLFNWR